MKKLLLGILILSSLQFAQEEDKLETKFDFESKLDVLQYFPLKNSSNYKPEDAINIIYAKGKFELPTLKLAIGYDVSQKTDKFDNLNINDLNAGAYLKYETPSYKDKLSGFFRADFLIGPKEKEGDFYFDLGLRYDILDNLVYKQSLKYYSNKLKTPKKLTTITEFNYNNEDLELKLESVNEIGGYIGKLENTDKIKNTRTSFIYDFNEKLNYKNYEFDLKINGEKINYISKEFVKEEVKPEENNPTIDGSTNGSTNDTNENTAVSSEEKTIEKISKIDKNKFEISLNTKFKNIYKNLFVEPSFKYKKDIQVYASDNLKEEELKKVNYNNDGIDTSLKVGYDFYINDIVSVVPYSTLDYSYLTNSYNQIQWLAGTSVNVRPMENIKLDFDVKVPIAFTFDKEKVNDTDKDTINFRYKKAGIGAMAKFSYSW